MRDPVRTGPGSAWGIALLVGVLVLGAAVAPAYAGGAPAAAQPSAADEAAADLAVARAIESGLVNVVEKTRRATVSVLHRRHPKNAPRGPLVITGVGSGVLVRQGGTWVLTSQHVIQGAEALEVVTWDGTVFPVKVQATDAASDLALLDLSAAPADLELEPVDLPDPASEEAVCATACGSWVLATGNPFLLANDGSAVATTGVVSGLVLADDGRALLPGTIQHDAPVNPGNSGGPLWTLNGRLLGINETIATHSRALGSGPHSTGASFSVGLERIRDVVSALAEGRTADRAEFRGLSFRTAVGPGGRPAGAELTGIDDAGKETSTTLELERGDVVTSVTVMAEDHTVRTAEDLAALLSARAGTEMRIDYVRDGESHSWSGALPPEVVRGP